MRNIHTWHTLPHSWGVPQPGQFTQVPSATLRQDFEPAYTKTGILKQRMLCLSVNYRTLLSFRSCCPLATVSVFSSFTSQCRASIEMSYNYLDSSPCPAMAFRHLSPYHHYLLQFPLLTSFQKLFPLAGFEYNQLLSCSKCSKTTVLASSF